MEHAALCLHASKGVTDTILGGRKHERDLLVAECGLGAGMRGRLVKEVACQVKEHEYHCRSSVRLGW